VTKKETNLSGTLSEAVSVATSVAYTRQEIQKLKKEFVSLLEEKATEVIVEQVPGPIGPRGSIGANGAQGVKGDKGEKGDKGDTGERGEKGESGEKGDAGQEGLRGEKGEKGDVGIQGLTGEVGQQGPKGDRGDDGKNGLDGRDGQTGEMGAIGPAGQQGIQGEQGLRGDKGDRGERGERGEKGQQGIQGPAGLRGEVGPQGIQGDAGKDGKDGKDGDIKPVEEKFQKFIDNVQKDVSAFKTKVNAAILKSGPNDAWKATGSGEVNLRYLDDVDRDSITDGYVLSYDEASKKFVFVEGGTGGGTVDTIARSRATSAWYTANLAYTQANSAFSTANASYIQANTGTTLAQAAYNYANTISLAGYAVNTTLNLVWSTANNSYEQANTALDVAQSAFAKANTGGAAGTDNLARSIANSAFATANTKSYTFSQNTAPATANTNDFWANTDSAVVYYNFGNTSSPLWVEFGPTGTSTSGGNTDLTGYAVNTTVNLIWSTTNSAFNQANTATNIAQAAYNFANTIVSDTQIDPFARSQANSAFNQANTATSNAATANSIAVSAFAQANTATTNASNADVKAQAAYDYANTIVVPSLSGYATNTTVNLVWSTANNAYAQANSANSLAQAAYDYANTLSGNVSTLQQVTTAGNTTTRGMTTSTLAFNLTSANTVTTGQMAWNAADLTVDIGMANGVTLQVGQEQYIKIKAGEAIADGEAVMFGGATGEHIIGLRNNMSATGYIPEWFIGVATQNFALNEFGYVTVFGKINGLNTLAYTVGDILYADPAVIGGLTKVEPQAPNLHIIVAAVTKRAGGDGHILVRPSFRPKLSNLSDVQITNIANNNLIKYNSANSRFENVSASSVIEPAYAQANSALSIAQSAFAQANTGGAAGTDNVARSIANSAFSTANSAFAKANTGTSQLVNGASTVSLSENGNLTVPGSISGLGNSKLDFNTYGANTAYLTTTNDDSTALFMGLVTAELYAHTNILIRTNTVEVSKNWTFGADGSTTLPGTVDITYTPDTATGSAITINGANTQGGTGYADFLKVTNTSGDATNPNKTFRLNSTGDLEIINSAYDANLFSLTNAGGLSVPGPISVGGKQAVNGPAFRAYVATGQAITSGSQQKVTFGTENFDTNGNFASSRFTPTIEGYYQLNANIRIDGTSSTGEVMIILYKNGSEYARGHNQSGTEQGASFYSMSVSDIAYANGSTDHFEVYIQQSSGGNRNTTAGSPISYFSGSMIRGA
jgi:hypothetical protein